MKKFKSFKESINEYLPEYKDWGDINNPIDMNKKPLKVGDYVKMDDLSPFRGKIENKWKILSFNKGTSAGVEAKIENVKTKGLRSEAVRYLIKTR